METQAETNAQRIQRLLAEKRQEIGQRVAGLPATESNLRRQLFGEDVALGTLRSQEEAKIKELFAHDQAVAAKYAAQPPPEPGMILDPYLRELDITQRYRGTMEDLTGIRRDIATRRDILGESLSKAMTLFQAGIQASQIEANFLDKELERELRKKEKRSSDILSILGVTGGAIPSDILSELGLPEGLKLPGRQPTTVETTTTQWNNMVSDIRDRGMTLRDALQKYGAYFSPNDIYSAYNSAVKAKEAGGYGPAEEPPEELERLGIVPKQPRAETQFDEKIKARASLLDDISKSTNRDGNSEFMRLRPLYPELTPEEIKMEMIQSKKFKW